jgi:septum formation protein
MFQQEEEGLKTKILLASASPRRKKILRDLGLDFEVAVPKGSIELKNGDPVRIAVENSMLKARDVLKNIRARRLRYLISGFDTVVYLRKKIFGKPLDIDEAYSFISALSGKVHRVITGICIIDSITGRQVTGREISSVRFRDLAPDEIRNYLERESVLDKAGAYNIAGPGALLVDKVQGCLFNIIGLPVFRYMDLLERFDYKIFYHSKE